MKYGPFLVFVLVTASLAEAGDWPQWRGPFFNGSTDEKDLPSDWSKTENIAWSVDLPGCAAAERGLPRQVYRQLDENGMIQRDVLAPITAEPEPGLPE